MNHHASVFRNGAVNINVNEFDKGQNSIRIPTNQSINQSVDIRNYDKNGYIICNIYNESVIRFIHASNNLLNSHTRLWRVTRSYFVYLMQRETVTTHACTKLSI